MMKFGELEAIRLLGRGGMSEVWEAVNPRLKSRHAVKIYAYGRQDATVRARFEQEGRMLARLHHPRIVGVSDVGTAEDGRPFFVMDLILSPEGIPQTLADIPEGTIDEGTIARWYDDIREALAHIHAKGIVHRDLKLQNAMIGPDGHVVLTDFGISHVTGSPNGEDVVSDPVQTILHMRDGNRPLMGSLGYMAPELEMGCPATPQSDWFALGIIVYRLLTGTWCDARTDLAGTLGAFDPTWLRIIPKLLHSNPSGRDCPSFAETHTALCNEEACAAEARAELVDGRLRRLRRLVITLAGACTVLTTLLVITTAQFDFERRSWRLKLQQAGTRSDAPTFDELFAIPPEAKTEATEDENGTVTVPSRSQLIASRVDALVLTQGILSALAAGSFTTEQVIADFERMADELEDDAATSPLDLLDLGGNGYFQNGDNTALCYLLRQAAEKLRARIE